MVIRHIGNAYAESFIGRLRDECLNENCFVGLKDARDVIVNWRIDYNDGCHTARCEVLAQWNTSRIEGRLYDSWPIIWGKVTG